MAVTLPAATAVSTIINTGCTTPHAPTASHLLVLLCERPLSLTGAAGLLNKLVGFCQREDDSMLLQRCDILVALHDNVLARNALSHNAFSQRSEVVEA